MTTSWKYQKVPLLLSVLSLVFYGLFAYTLERTESFKLLGFYVVLFLLAYQLIKQTSQFRFLVVASVIFRLIFLFAEPNLSQDYYRFIWDGRMLLEGFNPYLYLPVTFSNEGVFPVEQGGELFRGMGALSASNYTNYPPLNQLCFVLAGLLSGKSILGSVVVMRLIIISADIGIMYFGRKILQALNLSSNRIFWYALNPFIIIELTGNLHFEGLMLFFLVWSLYLLHQGKWQWAGLVLGCSIATKLIPLMLMPLFFWWFIKKQNLAKLIWLYAIVGFTVIILYAPFFSMVFITNYSESVGLWFGKFEFNASIYYLAREIGYWITGYNEIAIISKILSALTVLAILGLAFFKKGGSTQQLMTSMLWAISIFFFFGTTIHPWYISSLVLLCVFTNYKFPLVWSVVVVFSYLAYTDQGFNENLWVVFSGYVLVYAVIGVELRNGCKRPLAL